MIQLTITYGGTLVKYAKLSKDLITIGRSPSNDIVLDAPGVSRVHSKIYRADFCFFFKDLDSANGSFLNGAPITSAVPLSNGTKIVLDIYTLEFLEIAENSFPLLNVAEEETRKYRPENLQAESEGSSDQTERTAHRKPAPIVENQKTHLFSRVFGVSEQQLHKQRVSRLRPVVGCRRFINRNLQFVVDYSLDNEQSSIKINDATISDEIYRDEINETFLDEISVLSEAPIKELAIENTVLSNPQLRTDHPNKNAISSPSIQLDRIVEAAEPSVTEKESADSFLQLLGIQAEQSKRVRTTELAVDGKFDSGDHQTPVIAESEIEGETPVAAADNAEFLPRPEEAGGILNPTLNSDEPEIIKADEEHGSAIQVIKIGGNPDEGESPLNLTSETTSDPQETLTPDPKLPSGESDDKTDIYQYSPERAAQLFVIEGALSQRSYLLEKDEIWIGRSEECEILTQQLNCSRRHAVIRRQNEIYTILDNNATNGIKVNGQQVSTHELQNHDVIQIADLYLEFCVTGDQPTGRIPKAVALEGTGTLLAGQDHNPIDLPKFRLPSLNRNRSVRIALLVVFIIVALYLLFNKGERPTEIVRSKTEQALVSRWLDISKTIREDSIKTRGVDITEANPLELRDEVLKQLEASAFTKPFVPEAQKLFEKNPSLAKELLIHPEKVGPLLAELQKTHSGPSAYSNLDGTPKAENQRDVFETLNQLMSQKRYDEVIASVDQFLQTRPDDLELRQIKDLAIRERKNDELRQQIDSQNAEQNTDTANRRELVMGLITKANDDIGRSDYESAKSRIDQALELAPDDKDAQKLLKMISKTLDERKQEEDQKEQIKEQQNEAAKVFYEKAREESDRGDFEAAYKTIKIILAKYEASSYWYSAKESEVALRERLDSKYQNQLEHARASMNEGLYSEAWKGLYTVLSQFPDSKIGKELHNDLTAMTELEVKKHFNVARLYESEVADYDSALEEYEKVLTIADPQGDYYRRAVRKKQEIEKMRIRIEDVE